MQVPNKKIKIYGCVHGYCPVQKKVHRTSTLKGLHAGCRVQHEQWRFASLKPLLDFGPTLVGILR
jgi:hypothetical protein